MWINHWLRTGLEMFTNVGQQGYVAEKAEGEKGWLFPVGDQLAELGYVQMFARMLDALDSATEPIETFYDGYVVNAIMDAAYRSMESKLWEPVILDIWRGAATVEEKVSLTDHDAHYYLIKQERMPDGKTKLILKDKHSGEVVQKFQ